jgi:uncharacterized glyoxalase superfamily protein PhnB
MASIVPYFGYRDAPAAIEFLVSAFGMERVNVVEEDGGLIAHAELRHGDGVIMLGSWLEGQGEGAPMQNAGTYLVVDDVDAHHSAVRHAPLPRAGPRGIRVELRDLFARRQLGLND